MLGKYFGITLFVLIGFFIIHFIFFLLKKLILFLLIKEGKDLFKAYLNKHKLWYIFYMILGWVIVSFGLIIQIREESIQSTLGNVILSASSGVLFAGYLLHLVYKLVNAIFIFVAKRGESKLGFFEKLISIVGGIIFFLFLFLFYYHTQYSEQLNDELTLADVTYNRNVILAIVVIAALLTMYLVVKFLHVSLLILIIVWGIQEYGNWGNPAAIVPWDNDAFTNNRKSLYLIMLYIISFLFLVLLYLSICKEALPYILKLY